ncbi:acyltransferase domain-containing protein [Streptomyces sp. M19]
MAAVNGPTSVVVSGEPEALDALHTQLTAEDIRARRIPVDYASHSPQIEAVRDSLLQALAPLTPAPPPYPLLHRHRRTR